MEQKLKNYRAQKQRIEFYENFKAKLWKMVSFNKNIKKEEDDYVIEMVKHNKHCTVYSF